MRILATGVGKLIKPVPSSDQVQQETRTLKSLALTNKVMSAKEAVQRYVQENDYVVSELTGNVRGPMALIREVVRQGFKDLKAAGNTSTLDIDLLLQAGCVKELDLCYVGYELLGTSYTMRKMIEEGKLKITEWSNATMAWRLKAAAMGVPFLPCRSMLEGTDTFKYSAAKIAECPFSGDRVCVVPALRPDVALIHVHRCDIYGNAQIDGITGSTLEVAAASKKVIISTEKIIDHDEIRKNPERTAIPYFMVNAVVEAPFGAHPGNMPYLYDMDVEHYKEYINYCKTGEGIKEYFNKFIYNVPDNDGYLKLIGEERLEELKRKEQIRYKYREE